MGIIGGALCLSGMVLIILSFSPLIRDIKRKEKRASKTSLKLVVPGLIAFILGLVIIPGDRDETSQTKEAETATAAEEEKSEEMVQKDNAVQEETAEEVENQSEELSLEETILANTKAEEVNLENGILELTIDGSTMFSENTIVTSHAYFAFEAISEGFKFDEVDEVLVSIIAPFYDNKGNENMNTALELAYTRDTFNELDYENFLKLASGQEWRILNESDLYYIHRAIYDNIDQEYKDNLINGISKFPEIEE
ncbi:hypothetical protein MHH67_13255 [Bacillus sp. FSL K6-0047]